MYLWSCRRPRVRLRVSWKRRYIAEVRLRRRAEEDLAHERLYRRTTRQGQQNVHCDAAKPSLSSIAAVAIIRRMTDMDSDILARTKPIEDDLRPAVCHADRAFGVGLTASSGLYEVLRGNKYSPTSPPALHPRVLPATAGALVNC